MNILNLLKQVGCLVILSGGLGILTITSALAAKKTSDWTLNKCLKVCTPDICHTDRKFQCKRNCKAFKKTSKVVKECIVGYQRAAKDEMREGIQKQRIEKYREKYQQSQEDEPQMEERERLFDEPPYEGAERLFD
jgi:hypothetical protein